MKIRKIRTPPNFCHITFPTFFAPQPFLHRNLFCRKEPENVPILANLGFRGMAFHQDEACQPLEFPKVIGSNHESLNRPPSRTQRAIANAIYKAEKRRCMNRIRASFSIHHADCDLIHGVNQLHLHAPAPYFDDDQTLT